MKRQRIPATLEDLVAPKTTGLIAWDWINATVDHWGGRAVIGNMRRLLEAARAGGVPVVHTQPNYGPIREKSAAFIRWGLKRNNLAMDDVAGLEKRWGGISIGHPMTAFPEEVKPAPGEKVIPKDNEILSWFEMDQYFRVHGVQTVVITGLTSCGGIYPTARYMHNLGYHTVVVSDCIATKNTTLQKAALAILRDHFELATSTEIARVWRRKGGGDDRKLYRAAGLLRGGDQL